MNDIQTIARDIVAVGKGLLAADESVHTANKRLTDNGIDPNEEMRRQYRELFLTAPDVEKYLSGVILFEETLGQSTGDGTPFSKLLSGKGIIPGIKVDKGTEPFDDSPDELITNGLIGLPERLVPFYEHGARFTKWRAVIRIDGDTLPTSHAILENAKRLASYAHDAQVAGFVPILEPEVLLEGNHSILRAKEVITEALRTVFTAMDDHPIDKASLIIKTSMVLSGSTSGKTDAPEEVAEHTLDALIASVPADVPGIVFLSGGQSPDQATDNLRAIARLAKEKKAPWSLTFSYARALQSEALAVWQGKKENVPQAQDVFIARLYRVSEASLGN